METRTGNPFRETLGKTDGVYVVADVSSYLVDTQREYLCADLFQCDAWNIEPVLLEDLRNATSDEERDKLRGLIRAVTNIPPDHRSVHELLRSMDMHTRLHDEGWQHVEEALQPDASSHIIEDAMRIVESRYTALLLRWQTTSEQHLKEMLRRDIEALRPIRNKLYLRHVHPVFAARVSA
jgi:hypothetical protein